MAQSNQFIVFGLDDWQFAISVESVHRVIHAAELTPLPKAPDIVLGIINFQGDLLPVVNMRRRFKLPERPVSLTDRIIIAKNTKGRLIGITVDTVSTAVEFCLEDTVGVEAVLTGTAYVKGAVKTAGGIVLIHDIDTFLSIEEEAAMDEALGGCIETE